MEILNQSHTISESKRHARICLENSSEFVRLDVDHHLWLDKLLRSPNE